jgi:hypothetical protein
VTVACPKCEAAECRCRQPFVEVKPPPLPVKCYGERVVRCVMSPPAWGRRDGVMSKKEPKHEIKYDDVQAVLMDLKETRGVVEAALKEQRSATVQVLLAWITSRIRDAERLTLIARSGPNIIEDLRKEGHDV